MHWCCYNVGQNYCIWLKMKGVWGYLNVSNEFSCWRCHLQQLWNLDSGSSKKWTFYTAFFIMTATCIFLENVLNYKCIVGFIQVDSGFVFNKYSFEIVSRPVVKRVLKWAMHLMGHFLSNFVEIWWNSRKLIFFLGICFIICGMLIIATCILHLPNEVKMKQFGILGVVTGVIVILFQPDVSFTA